MIGAIGSVAILLALAALHAYWAAGGTFGKAAAIPEDNGRPVLKPRPAAICRVALALVIAALLIVLRAGLIRRIGAGPVLRLASWGLAAIFMARAVGDFRYVGFFKRVRGTRFARLDTALYSPLCCLLALLIADAARM